MIIALVFPVVGPGTGSQRAVDGEVCDPDRAGIGYVYRRNRRNHRQSVDDGAGRAHDLQDVGLVVR